MYWWAIDSLRESGGRMTQAAGGTELTCGAVSLQLLSQAQHVCLLVGPYIKTPLVNDWPHLAGVISFVLSGHAWK
jgi:hypothetical protein